MESSVIFVAEIFCCFWLNDHMLLSCHQCCCSWPIQPDRDRYRSDICQLAPQTLAIGSRQDWDTIVRVPPAYRTGCVVRFPNFVLVISNRYFVIPALQLRWPNSGCVLASSCDTWWPQFYCVHVSDVDDPHPQPWAVTKSQSISLIRSIRPMIVDFFEMESKKMVRLHLNRSLAISNRYRRRWSPRLSWCTYNWTSHHHLSHPYWFSVSLAMTISDRLLSIGNTSAQMKRERTINQH